MHQGCPDDRAVGAEGYVVDIPHVKAEFLCPREVVAAVALRPAGNTWAHVVATHLLGGVEGKVLHEQRTGTDKAHVALEDVPELRKLVERGVAHKGAEPGDSLLVRQELAVRAFAFVHGLELDNLKRPALVAGTLLKEKDACALVEEMKQDGNRQENRTEHYQHSCAGSDVYGSFEESAVHQEFICLLGHGRANSLGTLRLHPLARSLPLLPKGRP